MNQEIEHNLPSGHWTTTIDIPDGLTRKEKHNLVLAEKQRVRDEVRAEQLTAKRQALQDNPFDPRTEVSEDASRIIKTLWTIFVLIPIVLGILFAIVAANKRKLHY